MKKYYSTLFFIMISIITFSLGTWQVSRLKEKTQYIAEISTLLEQKSYQEIHSTTTLKKMQMIQISGKLFCEKSIYLFSTMNKKSGYYVITPLKSTDGTYMLISRGWIPKEKKDSQDLLADCNSNSIFRGITKNISSTIRAKFIKNDKLNNEWFYIEKKEIEDHINVKLANVMLEITDNEKKYLFKNRPLIENIKNDHLEYAITWYVLSIFAFIFSLIIMKGNKLNTNK